MSVFEIDRLLGQTPCLCGALDTWHPECYSGKSSKRIADAYRRMYARIRRRLARERSAMARNAIK